jgi:hypothetical protein
LPVGKEVYVFAQWDADNNGIQTNGDFIASSGSVEIMPSGSSTNINISSSIRMNLPGVMMLLLD